MSKVVGTVRITTVVAGVDEGITEGEVLDRGQVGVATMMTTMDLEIVGEQLDGVAAEDVVPEMLQRREDEAEDEEDHEQREELSLFLPKMVCSFSPLLFVTNHRTDFAPPPPPRRPAPPVQPTRRTPSVSASNSDHPNCDCNTPALERTVQKEGVNKGRKFWKCGGGPEKDCDFFTWADGNLPPNSRTVSGSNTERMIPVKRKVHGITRLSHPCALNGAPTNAIGFSSTALRPSHGWPIKTLCL